MPETKNFTSFTPNSAISSPSTSCMAAEISFRWALAMVKLTWLSSVVNCDLTRVTIISRK